MTTILSPSPKDQVEAAYHTILMEGDAWLRSLDTTWQLGLYRPTTLVYHYTNATGVYGMLTDNKLRATNLAYLNDSQEFEHGKEAFAKAIDAKIAASRVGSPEREIAEELQVRLQHKRSSAIYACCFAENGDQLSQWRGYGEFGAGYAVGFDFSRSDCLTAPSGKFNGSWVIYDDTAKQQFCQQTIGDQIDRFLQLLPSPLKIMDYLPYIVEALEAEMDTAMVIFKDSGFKEEQEYRLRLAGPQTRNVKLRPARNYLVPFVELEGLYPSTSGVGLPIREIVIGPKINEAKARQSLEVLLANNRYALSGIDIRKSSVPFA